MFLEYLPEPIAQLFGFCARALDDEDFVALRAFARSGQAYLKGGNQFRFFMHASCCHRFARGVLSLKVPSASEIATNHVGADVLVRPAERSSAISSSPQEPVELSLDRADEGVRPYVVRGI